MSLPSVYPERHNTHDIQEQHNFTTSWVRGHPAGAPYRQGCEDFQAQLTKNLQSENELRQKITDAFVKAFLMDRELNDMAKRVIALLPLQKDQDPAALQERLLEGLPLSKFVKPTLGGQLKAMKGWVAILRVSSHPELQALSNELEAKTTLASKLEEELNTAENTLGDFIKLGGRVKLFADFNALRNTIHKGVGKDNPDLAEEFFLHDTSRTTTLNAAVQESQTKIERLTASLEAEQKRLAELQAKKSARDAEEAARQEAQQSLAQLKQQQAELKQQEAKLKAQAKGKR